MKKILLASALALSLAVGAAPALSQTSTDATTTPATATTTAFTIKLMKHVCPATVKSTGDLVAIGENAGTDPIARFLAMELACPTTALPGHPAATSSIAAERMSFDFAVIGLGAANASTTATTTQHLGDANYVNHRICETDAGIDFNKNGTTSPSTCLDASHYEFSGFALQATSTGTSTPQATTTALVSILETSAPSGYRFGALSFTPPELMPNDDLKSFVSVDSSDRLIVLDVATDTDRTVMLHVFNFLVPTTTGTSTATTTPPGTGTTTPPGTGTTTPPGTGTTTPPGTGTTTPPDDGGESLRDRLELMRSRIQSRMSELRNRLEGLRERLEG